MVYLRVENKDSSECHVFFRRKGLSTDYDDVGAPGGAGAIADLGPGKHGTVVVKTDSSGVVEWKTSAARNLEVWVESYIRIKTIPVTSQTGSGNNFAMIGAYDAAHYGVSLCYVQNVDAAVEKEWFSFAGLGSEALRHVVGRWNNTSDKITKITVTAVIGTRSTGSVLVLEGTKQ